MKWSYRIGRVGETDIKVHATFVLLLVWYAWEAWARGGASLALRGTLFLLALFTCVVLHEFGHILMARRFGVRTPDVILLPIGGLARLERIPEEPKQELLIALAGPAVTLAIALGLYGALRLTGTPLSPEQLEPAASGLLQKIMWVNVVLLLFNMLPAFPMDGGRVLRALLAMRLGLARATRLAANIGQLAAVGLGLWGLGFFSAWGLAPNAFLVLIAVFVFFGAGGEAAAVETKLAGRGLDVSRMMITRFRSLPTHATLQEAVNALLEGEQREFPVVDNWGKVEGILTRENLIRGLAERGPGSIVDQAVTRPVTPVAPGLPFADALERLRLSGLPALPVVDGSGTLVGLLTTDNISDLLLVRRAQVASSQP